MKKDLLFIIKSPQLHKLFITILEDPKISLQRAISTTMVYYKHETAKIKVILEDNSKIIKTTLSVRAKNLLAHHKILTVQDLLQLDTSQLVKWQNCGNKTAQEIRLFIDSFGLKLDL